MGKLVIVESPTKANTISKMLPKGTKVMASKGHLRDLPKSRLGVDIENNFEPEYINVRGKGSLINELKKESKNATEVFLATDPDREGEAIAWHLAHILNLEKDKNIRVTFNEITKGAVLEALKKPGKLDLDTVDAQQARRVLDRIVGYKISPVLRKNVRNGLSAGRVQSVALKLIVDREREILNFKPEEYWTLNMHLLDNKDVEFLAKFYGKDGKKVEIKSENEVKEIISKIDTKNIIVSEIKLGTRKRNPAPPFTTSSLQQTAGSALGFSIKKTMMVAQKLYEGIKIPSLGLTGLITYMRTDSVRISESALSAAKEYIEENIGKEFYEKRYYKGKKSAQDAHEAIRPSKVELSPDKIKEHLSLDEYKLYNLIYKRFIASQMKSAIYDTITIKFDASTYEFRTSGSKLNFSGYLKVYGFVSDEEKLQDKKNEKIEKNKKKSDEDEEQNVFPELKEKERAKFKSFEKNQNFTNPPARYTESTLVKTMEENGVGRPSTYSPTISTIISRRYVEKEGRQFKPTKIGFLVTDILVKYFPKILNIEFTANIEEELDKIAEGDLNWKTLMNEFYKTFKSELDKASKDLEKLDIKQKTEIEYSDEICEKCGKPMVYKEGRFGKFLACSGYPECKNTKNIDKFIEEKCPECGGRVTLRRSKRGYPFYICENNKGENAEGTTCKYISWTKPGEKDTKKTEKKSSKKKGKKLKNKY